MDILSWLTLNETSGVYIIFVVLVLCGLGLPIPEDIPLVALGYLWHLSATDPVSALLAGFAGVLLGDSALYYIGRRFGPELFRHKILLKMFAPRRINRTKARFRKYGLWVVFVGRFLAGLRAIVFFTAGATRIQFRKFLWVDFLAALVSIPLWIGLGYYFGDEIQGLVRKISKSKDVALAVVLGAIALYVFLKWIISRLRSKKPIE